MSFSTSPDFAPATRIPVLTKADAHAILATQTSTVKELGTASTFLGLTLGWTFTRTGLVVIATEAVIALPLIVIFVSMLVNPVFDFSWAQAFGYFPAATQYGIDYTRN